MNDAHGAMQPAEPHVVRRATQLPHHTLHLVFFFLTTMLSDARSSTDRSVSSGCEEYEVLICDGLGRSRQLVWSIIHWSLCS